MNKINPRLEPNYHISKIQANLKEMKDEVDGFLKKNNRDTVPPILRGRHYLLLDTINHLGIIKSIESPKKLIRDLSSEVLMPVSESDRFEPLRSLNPEKREKNRIVKQKKMLTGRNSFSHGLEPQQSCLLPNICNLKLDYDDSFIVNSPPKRQYKEDKHEESQDEHMYDSLNIQKRYKSIDLCRQSILSEVNPDDIKSTLRGSKTKWLQRSVNRHLLHNQQFQKTLQSKFNQILAESLNHHNEKTVQNPKIHEETVFDASFTEKVIVPENSHMLARRSQLKKIRKEAFEGDSIKERKFPNLGINKKQKRKPLKQSKYDLSKFDPWQNQETQTFNELLNDYD